TVGRIGSVKVTCTLSELAQPSALTVPQMKTYAPAEMAETVVVAESGCARSVPAGPLHWPVLHVPVALNVSPSVQLMLLLPASGAGTRKTCTVAVTMSPGQGALPSTV